jgi:hypothetical protein
MVALSPPRRLNQRPGYFRFGPDLVCYGQSMFRSPAVLSAQEIPDLSQYIGFDRGTPQLPFDASQVVNNLRYERYPTDPGSSTGALLASRAARRAYYGLRPLLSQRFRSRVQRLFFSSWEKLPFPKWPVDTSVEQILEKLLLLSMKARNLERIPFIWFWPDGADAAAMVTHDVETARGFDIVPRLMDVDDEFGIKTSFQIVPEKRYQASKEVLDSIRRRGCEVNVHSLNHDGNLFHDRKTFLNQAKKINHYVEEYGAGGFRSASMYRNVDWLEDLKVAYDMSVPTVAHLEPQRGGCCTVFPYFIGNILELPLTTVQDYSLLHIIGDYSIDLWKKQMELIAAKNGLMSFIIHPDYIMADKALAIYRALLAHLSSWRDEKRLWIARSGDINQWWRQRSAMKLVFENGKWCIQGQGRERARIVFAGIQDDGIVFSGESNSETLGAVSA